MNYRYYALNLETPKRHCRRNQTRVLPCRIFCADHATYTALHVQNEILFPVQNCADLIRMKTAALKLIQFT